MIELLVVVGIIGILSAVAMVNFIDAQTRAHVAASKAKLRTLGGAIEIYCVDKGSYPLPVATLPDDPLGVLASTCLKGLTTPIAYVTPDVFRDPFGTLEMQIGYGGGITLQGVDPFRPPEPDSFNKDQSLLYIHYPSFSNLIGDPSVSRQAFSAISIGPDLKDSLIAFYPFPNSLPSTAPDFGVNSASDTVYDPTNGTASTGDIAWFGGMLPKTQLVGGGN